MSNTYETVNLATVPLKKTRKNASPLWKRAIPLYLMILPGFMFFVVFKYVPMAGVLLAFKDYDPFVGFFQSNWVGFQHFNRLFHDSDFWGLLRNSLLLSGLNLLLFFPAPILVALLLNEVRKAWFRKTVQTIIYVPHFLSWVIVVSITVLLFSTQEGGVNQLLAGWGLPRMELLTDPDYFRVLYNLQSVWKEAGWAAIIFLAALAAIDPTLYEASVVDGANRWRQMWHISLPALRTTIIVLFILRIGYVLDLSFEHVLLMQNPANISVSDIFDTYLYRNGILQGDFSYPTAIGLFKAVIGFILVVIVNSISKKFGEEGVY